MTEYVRWSVDIKKIAETERIGSSTGNDMQIFFLFLWYTLPKLTCQPSNVRNAQAWVTMATLARVYQLLFKWAKLGRETSPDISFSESCPSEVGG